MSQKELSIRADISPKQISGIVNGDFGITPETALKLERVL
jgi:plasmid maintenance system antidote protein VapI